MGEAKGTHHLTHHLHGNSHADLDRQARAICDEYYGSPELPLSVPYYFELQVHRMNTETHNYLYSADLRAWERPTYD